jgi:hypothetical protein
VQVYDINTTFDTALVFVRGSESLLAYQHLNKVRPAICSSSTPP